MGLSDDQRALLRLLAQREEGYEDIAALMGLSVDEVRSRVKGALKELDEEGAAAGPVGAGDPPPPPVAKASSGVVPPTPPPAEEAPAPPPSRRPVQSEPHRRAKPQMSRRRLWELVGGALVALLLILFATGAIDIGGESSDSDDSVSAGQIATPASGKQPTQALLEPVDGSNARGQALLGRVKNQIVLAIAAKGLEPSGQGESYAVSLVSSAGQEVPIAAANVGKSGEFGAQYPIAPNVLGLLASGFDQMEVSLVVNKELRTALTEARQEEAVPDFEGTEVLQGQITGPIVKAAAEGG